MIIVRAIFVIKTSNLTDVKNWPKWSICHTASPRPSGSTGQSWQRVGRVCRRWVVISIFLTTSTFFSQLLSFLTTSVIILDSSLLISHLQILAASKFYSHLLAQMLIMYVSSCIQIQSDDLRQRCGQRRYRHQSCHGDFHFHLFLVSMYNLVVEK